ncbi:LysR family transcriptional regulator [Vibrio maritimus]|uniref:LysR family transcriptional regulator n=1 Tax=Vibrio maritimus TaxID=990268 RepID=UPI001F32485F|nr:LysR family transcriptional regulator [Vibrio maritimus]
MRQLPSLNAVRVFEVAGTHLSFTAAANILNVTQGAVSKQIKQLEEYLGVPLFKRTSARGLLELTPIGEQVLDTISRSLSEVEKGLEVIRNPNLQQRLVVLAPPTFTSRWLSAHLVNFAKVFPQYDLQIYSKREQSTLYDIEILFDEVSEFYAKDNLLFKEKYVAVCNQDLVTESMNIEAHTHKMLHIRHHGHNLPAWKDWLESANIQLAEGHRKGISMSTQEQVINTAIAGGGFAVVDLNMVYHSLKKQELIQFHPLQCRSRYGYFIHVPTPKVGTSKVEAFVSWLKEECLSVS